MKLFSLDLPQFDLVFSGLNALITSFISHTLTNNNPRREVGNTARSTPSSVPEPGSIWTTDRFL